MDNKKNTSNKLFRFWKILGPGLVTGASDDDPSGIATYSQAGAAYGLATLWTALITFPLMASIQECNSPYTFDKPPFVFCQQSRGQECRQIFVLELIRLIDERRMRVTDGDKNQEENQK